MLNQPKKQNSFESRAASEAPNDAVQEIIKQNPELFFPFNKRITVKTEEFQIPSDLQNNTVCINGG